MKFAPVSMLVAASMAAGALVTPTVTLAQPAEYRSYEDYCHHQKKSGQRSGAILGAIAGAVIGSNMASHHGGRAGGAALGAAAGAAVGSNIGREAGKAKCDRNGNAYWTEDETYSYDDRAYYHGGGRYDDGYYRHHRCRWAREYDGSYVRVCPDRSGYYRVEY
ncbi:MAG: glycine zipper 2TM domain-containing protein [Proteobacteria bacterium]|nr:glycine zipper 2TM domain-containing protein [Pseudomonadota bacterium]